MPRYEVRGGYIVIEDEALKLSIKEPMKGAIKKVARRQDSSLLWEGYEKEGLFHGPLYTYFKNGKVSSSFWYIKGKPYGKATFFNLKGRISHIILFYDGKRKCEEWWYPDGTLRTRKIFCHGVLQKVQHYYPSGVLERHIRFLNGKKEGLDESFDPSGKIVFRLLYKKGRLVREIVEDKLGRAASLLGSLSQP
jgi:antitoxin component YwqK of YwqJK toxin-antitoxin module